MSKSRLCSNVATIWIAAAHDYDDALCNAKSRDRHSWSATVLVSSTHVNNDNAFIPAKPRAMECRDASILNNYTTSNLGKFQHFQSATFLHNNHFTMCTTKSRTPHSWTAAILIFSTSYDNDFPTCNAEPRDLPPRPATFLIISTNKDNDFTYCNAKPRFWNIHAFPLPGINSRCAWTASFASTHIHSHDDLWHTKQRNFQQVAISLAISNTNYDVRRT